MDMRVPQARRSPLAKFVAWTILILGLVGTVAAVAELHVVYAVYSLIAMSLAGIYLLKQKSLDANRVERPRDLFTGR
ncbi:hypothetical protein [Tomitella biformata]|uniref:hypothetical protein n=1 Tax=Tomitella biformata TaxID=630403 RepID=UPI0004ACA2DC|nr:hypothetical protein [Tomitella biformata]